MSHFSKEVYVINELLPILSVHFTLFGVEEALFHYEVNNRWSEQHVVHKRKENKVGMGKEDIKEEL